MGWLCSHGLGLGWFPIATEDQDRSTRSARLLMYVDGVFQHGADERETRETREMSSWHW